MLYTIAAVWVAAAVVSMPPIFGAKDPEFEHRVQNGRCMVSQDVGYQIFATISTFYGPSFFILLLYWKIYKVRRMPFNDQLDRKPKVTSNNNFAERFKKRKQPKESFECFSAILSCTCRLLCRDAIWNSITGDRKSLTCPSFQSSFKFNFFFVSKEHANSISLDFWLTQRSLVSLKSRIIYCNSRFVTHFFPIQRPPIALQNRTNREKGDILTLIKPPITKCLFQSSLRSVFSKSIWTSSLFVRQIGFRVCLGLSLHLFVSRRPICMHFPPLPAHFPNHNLFDLICTDRFTLLRPISYLNF
jgi:hypothetical protein